MGSMGDGQKKLLDLRKDLGLDLTSVCGRYAGDTPNFSHRKYGLLTLEEVSICWLPLVSPHRDSVMPTETLCPGPYCSSEGDTPLRLDMLRVYLFIQC